MDVLTDGAGMEHRGGSSGGFCGLLGDSLVERDVSLALSTRRLGHFFHLVE
jgi:hypothetical protein